MPRRRFLVAGALAVVALGAALAVYAYLDSRPTEKRGSPAEEFDRGAVPLRRTPPRAEVPWPTYGFDSGRTHLAGDFRHRPPYRRLWKVDARDTVEFPPSIGYGLAFIPQQLGLFLAVDAKTGKLAWRRDFKRCVASSPTLGNGLVYQSFMERLPCGDQQPGDTGLVIAMDAKTGRERWRLKGPPVESTPLLRGRRLYVGVSRRAYALDARTGKTLWRFEAEDKLNTAPAYWRGRIYLASDGGRVYALSARSGKLLWRAESNARFGSREFFYATPTLAYGRVYIGNTDGTMYAYGARTGKLRWARPLGTYIYGAAAVHRDRVFVGTYSGQLFALDAATGDVKWRTATPAAVHAAPTVMAGLVYYATCSTCGRIASRYVKPGPKGTYTVRARDGKQVWSFRDGMVANPVVADEERIYITGRSFQYALEPRRSRRRR